MRLGWKNAQVLTGSHFGRYEKIGDEIGRLSRAINATVIVRRKLPLDNAKTARHGGAKILATGGVGAETFDTIRVRAKSGTAGHSAYVGLTVRNCVFGDRIGELVEQTANQGFQAVRKNNLTCGINIA